MYEAQYGVGMKWAMKEAHEVGQEVDHGANDECLST